MNQGKKALLTIGMVFVLVIAMLPGTKVFAASGQYQLSVKTDREEGMCTYVLEGVDVATDHEAEIIASYKNSKNETIVSYNKTIAITAENCSNGVLEGCFTMDDMQNFAYEVYAITAKIGGTEVVSETACDFSVHTNNCEMSVEGKKSDSKRTVKLAIKDTERNVIVPGKESKLILYTWKKDTEESKATKSFETDFRNEDVSASVDVGASGNATYYARFKIEQKGRTASLGKKSFTLASTASSFKTNKTKELEKKKAFAVSLKGLKNPVAVKKVVFYVYDSKGNLVLKKTATDKKNDKSLYYAEIKLKSLNYNLDKYTIKAYVTDDNNNKSFYSKSCTVSEEASAKSLTITKKKKTRSSSFKLSKPYVPGNIKKVEFWVYYKNGDKYKLLSKVKATYDKSKDSYLATNKNKYAGNYKICAYAYTNWGTSILLKTETVKVKKSEAAKNGWYYEKYRGTTYKFYYKDDVKQKDLTKVLKLKFSSSSNTNKFKIVVNRAACCVTVYAYDPKKKKYIIPVRTFTVSVGRDTRTNGDASGLDEDTSYTPLGNYSICSNGVSVKYSLKEMHEPDGSVVYARWASHIVGNVYFHSIAVGKKSHFALSPTTYNRLGSPASAGCIRMMVADAKWLYDYASAGSTVKIIAGSTSAPGPLGKSKTIKVSGSIHYDPSDPEVSTSRKKRDYKAGLISGYVTKSGKRVGF